MSNKFANWTSGETARLSEWSSKVNQNYTLLYIGAKYV
jgi:hypothetical protein